MAENVQTGGLMQFNYDSQKEASLDPERRNAINLGYAEAEERKRKERRSKIMFWIVIVLVIIGILGYILLKR